ncbi:flavodoxin domain-containing protein [Blastococcus sp. TF02A-30]|uniref:flavodoxin domain-containing protein n=1 Tax=Blastococcus sp. TF02A-30 TaxID=2250580 RepID=UPI000DE88E9D|nr:flavodoxin domain-containing protein [Blastococcus sp. TF02A-30]RBY87743.1 flavodoxin [Blastococcus sp. TF02A-30]
MAQHPTAARHPTAQHPTALIAYATAAGSTAGIAERIAATLAEDGAEVTCRAVTDDLDPAGFDVVVVGSAVHSMAWLPPALAFLPKAAASGAPVWCFSVGGLASPDSGRVSRYLAAGELRRIETGFPHGFTPREHRLFTGVVDVTRSPLWGRVFYRLTGGSSGDHRDWAAVAAWARRIATAMHGKASAAGSATA